MWKIQEVFQIGARGDGVRYASAGIGALDREVRWTSGIDVAIPAGQVGSEEYDRRLDVSSGDGAGRPAFDAVFDGRIRPSCARAQSLAFHGFAQSRASAWQASEVRHLLARPARFDRIRQQPVAFGSGADDARCGHAVRHGRAVRHNHAA